jgi:hypothetical protein
MLFGIVGKSLKEWRTLGDDLRTLLDFDLKPLPTIQAKRVLVPIAGNSASQELRPIRTPGGFFRPESRAGLRYAWRGEVWAHPVKVSSTEPFLSLKKA